jgi:hypothetical protein
MSAFGQTQYRIRIQLVDENDKVIESYISPNISWLDGIDYFNRVNKTKWTNEMSKGKDNGV